MANEKRIAELVWGIEEMTDVDQSAREYAAALYDLTTATAVANALQTIEPAGVAWLSAKIPSERAVSIELAGKRASLETARTFYNSQSRKLLKLQEELRALVEGVEVDASTKAALAKIPPALPYVREGSAVTTSPAAHAVIASTRELLTRALEEISKLK